MLVEALHDASYLPCQSNLLSVWQLGSRPAAGKERSETDHSMFPQTPSDCSASKASESNLGAPKDVKAPDHSTPSSQ